MHLALTALMLGSGWLFLRSGKRLPAAPLIVLAFAAFVGCGGGGSSPQHDARNTGRDIYRDDHGDFRQYEPPRAHDGDRSVNDGDREADPEN